MHNELLCNVQNHAVHLHKKERFLAKETCRMIEIFMLCGNYFVGIILGIYIGTKLMPWGKYILKGTRPGHQVYAVGAEVFIRQIHD